MLFVPNCDEAVAVRCVDEHELYAFEAFVYIPDAGRQFTTTLEGGLEYL
jgi:hypothetical protein